MGLHSEGMASVAMAGHNASQWQRIQKATLEGENRDDATSGDAGVRAEYARKNGEIFWEILRMFNAKSEAGKTLMLQIQDEFWWEYLRAWASSLTPAEVKLLKSLTQIQWPRGGSIARP